MGLTKPRMVEIMPLVNRVERTLQTCYDFLTQADKLEMVNSVLSSLPTDRSILHHNYIS